MHIASRFQSTPLTRGETAWRRGAYGQGGISIHSPHTRGDAVKILFSFIAANFNPLPSHEGRLVLSAQTVSGDEFQSTPLTQGET